MLIVADEGYSFIPGFPIPQFLHSVGPHIPVENIDLYFRVGLFQLNGILHCLATTHAAAIHVCPFTRADTLYHNHRLQSLDVFYTLGDSLFKLVLSQDLFRLIIEILGGLVLYRTRGQDNHTMLYFFSIPTSSADGRLVVTHVA